MFDLNEEDLVQEDLVQEDGMFLIPIELEQQEKLDILRAYMLDNKFNHASIRTFDISYNTHSNLDSAISDAVINEFVIKATEDAILKLKNEVSE